MANDMTTVVTTFDDQDSADQAMDALRKEGFDGVDFKVLAGDADTLMNELTGYGFGKADAREFADAAGEGKTLVAAHVSKRKAEQAASIMAHYESSENGDSERGNGKNRGQTVPIVEEELSVEKSKVANGGVRVSSNVRETPVERKVTLREERVDAQRKQADRKLGADEAEAAFEEKTVEVMGTKEEAEVQKEARVVGEVAVSKETEEREETVRGSVRKTDVKVENVKAASNRRK
jgi:stress response protein YsnF